MKIGFLFDLDGTLLDTLQDLTNATNHTLRAFGLPERTAEEVRRFVGNGAEQLIRRSLPGREDDPDALEVLAAYKVYYNANCQVKTKPYDGIPEALERLGKRCPIAIVSNKPDSATKTLCAQYFPGVYARGEDADCPRKPAPDMILKTMAELGIEKCVYVGDSEVDVVTANNAGMPCLSVTWGFRDRETLACAGAKWLCDTPTRMAAMLEEMAGELDGE